jgi:hypothetical protein
LLTVEGAIRPSKLTANPCANITDYPEWALFYNDTNNYYCFCGTSSIALKMSDEAVNCF